MGKERARPSGVVRERTRISSSDRAPPIAPRPAACTKTANPVRCAIWSATRCSTSTACGPGLTVHAGGHEVETWAEAYRPTTGDGGGHLRRRTAGRASRGRPQRQRHLDRRLERIAGHGGADTASSIEAGIPYTELPEGVRVSRRGEQHDLDELQRSRGPLARRLDDGPGLVPNPRLTREPTNASLARMLLKGVCPDDKNASPFQHARDLVERRAWKQPGSAGTAKGGKRFPSVAAA